jgi:hypothetical protein
VFWKVNVETPTNTSGKLLYISGTQYVYDLSNNTLTVKGYQNATGTADVVFTRIEGSTRTDEHDIWYTDLRTETDTTRTLLVIKSNNVTFTAVGPGSAVQSPDWDRWQYEPDTANSRVDWKDNNTTTSYSLDGSTLTLNWTNGSTIYTKTSL